MAGSSSAQEVARSCDEICNVLGGVGGGAFHQQPDKHQQRGGLRSPHCDVSQEPVSSVRITCYQISVCDRMKGTEAESV